MPMLSIAFMPSGVAAPFIPKRLALMFILTNFLLSGERLFFPKIQLTSGESSFAKSLVMPVCSKIEKMPIQTAYITQSSKVKESALFEAPSIPVITASGLTKRRAKMLDISRISHILFIFNLIVFAFQICTYVLQ